MRLRSQGLLGSHGLASPSGPPEGTSPAGALTVGLWPPELVSAAQSVVLCGGSHRKLTQTGSVMVSFMRSLGWANGCPDSW